MPFGWAQRRVKRGRKETRGGRGKEEQNCTLAQLWKDGVGSGRRAGPEPERWVVRPEPGHPQARRSFRGQSGLVPGARTPPPGSSGIPSWEPWNPLPGSRGRGRRRQRTPPALAQPGHLGSQRSERGSPRAQAPRARLGRGDGDPGGARRCCAPRRSRGAPSPGSPAPPPRSGPSPAG